jgi:hypothetical protein
MVCCRYDAFKIISRQEEHFGRIIDPLTELTICKGIEMAFESIP